MRSLPEHWPKLPLLAPRLTDAWSIFMHDLMIYVQWEAVNNLRRAAPSPVESHALESVGPAAPTAHARPKSRHTARSNQMNGRAFSHSFPFQPSSMLSLLPTKKFRRLNSTTAPNRSHHGSYLTRTTTASSISRGQRSLDPDSTIREPIVQHRELPSRVGAAPASSCHAMAWLPAASRSCLPSEWHYQPIAIG